MDNDFVVEPSPNPSNGSEVFEEPNITDEISVSNPAAVFVGISWNLLTTIPLHVTWGALCSHLWAFGILTTLVNALQAWQVSVYASLEVIWLCFYRISSHGTCLEHILRLQKEFNRPALLRQSNFQKLHADRLSLWTECITGLCRIHAIPPVFINLQVLYKYYAVICFTGPIAYHWEWRVESSW